MAEFCGKVRYVYDDLRLFQVLFHNRMYYFYLTRSQEKKFSPYLEDGMIVDMIIKEDQETIGNVLAYPVINFNRIYKIVGNKEVVYFDVNQVKDSVKKLLAKDRYRMFIDLEFTMPPYDYKHGEGKEFVAEIIQYGLYIEDSLGNLVDSASGMVRPTSPYGASDRMVDFLKVSRKEILKAPYYSKFYNLLKDYMCLYQPVIYMWGRNDYLMIEKSFEINKVKPIVERKHFVNLMQVIKNYFSVKNDIGLYAAFELFNTDPPMISQDHNALHDASATLQLFHLFEEMINK